MLPAPAQQGRSEDGRVRYARHAGRLCRDRPHGAGPRRAGAVRLRANRCRRRTRLAVGVQRGRPLLGADRGQDELHRRKGRRRRQDEGQDDRASAHRHGLWPRAAAGDAPDRQGLGLQADRDRGAGAGSGAAVAVAADPQGEGRLGHVLGRRLRHELDRDHHRRARRLSRARRCSTSPSAAPRRT